MSFARFVLFLILFSPAVSYSGISSVSVCGDNIYIYYSGKTPVYSRKGSSAKVIFNHSYKGSKKINRNSVGLSIYSKGGKTIVSIPSGVKRVTSLRSPRAIRISYGGKRTISLDAGHGGLDSGTVHGRLREKDIVTRYVSRLSSKLRREGYDVVLTRPPRNMSKMDELAYRVRKSNKAGADLFISVHVNAMENKRSISGIEIYYKGRVSKKISKTLGKNLKRLNKIRVKSSRFYVLRNTNSPSILLEVGYLSNYRDRVRLTTSSYINSIVSGVVKTIKKELPTKQKSCRKFSI